MEAFLLIIIVLILLIIFLIISNNYFNKKKYTAVIVEPREHKAFEFVLQNFLENLSDEWAILIMHGNKNINYINNIIHKKLAKNKNRITLINLKVDNLTIDDYNNLLVSEDFYNNIPTEIFLIFQTDTIICKENKGLINNFLQYDYVGAPWKDHRIGNGGLSLRKKSKMIEKIRKCKYNNQNEDLFFANSCYNIKKPTFEDSKYFSIESMINDKSFGVHKPWNNLKKDELDYLKNNCLNLDKLIELNK
jgi:hypothetical protein